MTHLKDSKECEKCGYGHYCGEPGRSDYSGECDPGFYCLRGSKVPNPPNVTESGGPCPVGHYCPKGTSYPLGCKEGAYNDRTGQSECKACCAGFYCPSNSTSCSKECPKGHYCLNGTQTPYQFPCPKGTYNNLTGMQTRRYFWFYSIYRPNPLRYNVFRIRKCYTHKHLFSASHELTLEYGYNSNKESLSRK